MGMDSDLDGFVRYIISWTEILREVKMKTGIQLNPKEFTSKFIALLSDASKTIELKKEIKRLKDKLKMVDNLKESFDNLGLNETIDDVIPNMSVQDGYIPSHEPDLDNLSMNIKEVI